MPSMEYTIYEEQMILGHLSPPVASAGTHGRKWREITTKITDASNNKVNNIMTASYVLFFSLTIHLRLFHLKSVLVILAANLAFWA